MKSAIYHSLSHAFRLLVMAILAITLTLGTGQTAHAQEESTRARVDLGAASPFAILTKTGITNVPTSAITGNLGASPISSTAITGFSLVADSTNTFSRSSQVTGKIYAANYAAPTPANLTAAVSNMEAAYTDAAGRTLPDFTELYAGNLSGRTLAPGLYKWSTGVLITSSVTLAGPENAVWIFQIAGDLTIGSGAKVLLSGGALPNTIFWQVGGTGVEIGTTAHMEGTILAKKAIHLRTGASLNGRALSQTAVTLAKNTVVIPTAGKTGTFVSDPLKDGWVLESNEISGKGDTTNSAETIVRIGDHATKRQYRAILHFNTASLPDAAVITSATLKLVKQGTVGVDPFTTHGNLLVDIRKQFFGINANLLSADFEANANAFGVAIFDTVPVAGYYNASLNATGRSLIDRTGATQFRLYFALDDNNNGVADYLKFHSGNAIAAMRPQLIIHYYVP